MASTATDFQALLAAAERLMGAARGDAALAERLLEAPGALVAEAAGCSLPEGYSVQAERADDGTVLLRAAVHDGAELPDEALENVAGGKWVNLNRNNDPTQDKHQRY